MKVPDIRRSLHKPIITHKINVILYALFGWGTKVIIKPALSEAELTENGTQEAKAGSQSISVQEMQRAGFIHKPKYPGLETVLPNSSQGITLFCGQ